MARSANLLDITALDALRGAIAKYGEAATNALYSANSEVRRCQDQLVERTKYWQREVQRRQEEVQRAKSNLAFAKSMRDGKSTGASEQEIALKKAQAKLQEAEEKLKACMRWKQQLPDQVREYETRVRLMNGFIETDLPKAMIFLQGRATALEKYLATVAPPPVGASFSSGGGSSEPPPEAPAVLVPVEPLPDLDPGASPTSPEATQP